MKGGIVRDLLLVAAPAAAVLAGLASVDHHQRLVEAGYRVAVLAKERDALALEVEHRRVRVARLSSPARLLGEARERKLPIDYPISWNVVAGDAEAARLVARKPTAPPAVAASTRPVAPPAVRHGPRGAKRLTPGMKLRIEAPHTAADPRRRAGGTW